MLPDDFFSQISWVTFHGRPFSSRSKVKRGRVVALTYSLAYSFTRMIRDILISCFLPINGRPKFGYTTRRKSAPFSAYTMGNICCLFSQRVTFLDSLRYVSETVGGKSRLSLGTSFPTGRGRGERLECKEETFKILILLMFRIMSQSASAATFGFPVWKFGERKIPSAGGTTVCCRFWNIVDVAVLK